MELPWMSSLRGQVMQIRDFGCMKSYLGENWGLDALDQGYP